MPSVAHAERDEVLKHVIFFFWGTAFCSDLSCFAGILRVHNLCMFACLHVGDGDSPDLAARWVSQEGPIDEQEFDVPSFCPEKPEPGGVFSSARHLRNMGGLARMRSLLPNAHYGELTAHTTSKEAFLLLLFLWY